MARKRTLSCPQGSLSVTNTHPGCPLQDAAKPGFCPSCYSRLQRDYVDLMINLGQLGELMEIIGKTHADEMLAMCETGKELTLKKQEELNIEIHKWLDAKFLEISVNEAIKAKMLAKLSLT